MDKIVSLPLCFVDCSLAESAAKDCGLDAALAIDIIAIIANITGEDDGERKGSVMKQTLYRLQSRAGLSLASTAAGAAGEDSGSVRADVLSHLVGCEERDRRHE